MKKIQFLLQTSVIVSIIIASCSSLPALISPLDKNPPTIDILFAGNMQDLGGPYWKPPEEDIQLTGEFENGYYANDSMQQENWLFIVLNVEDESGVGQVRIHWYDMTDNVWNNDSQAINIEENRWEWNSSWDVTVEPGHKYSFDVWAEDIYGTSRTEKWEKKYWGGYMRRAVSLGCTPESIEYRPLYMINKTNLTGEYVDGCRHDFLHHDQGMSTSRTDTAYLVTDRPGKYREYVYCGSFIGFWYEDQSCAESFTLTNIYYHWWVGGNSGASIMGWKKSRESLDHYYDGFWLPGEDDIRSRITDNYNGSFPLYDTYYLYTHLLTLPYLFITDNNIYEIAVKAQGSRPSTVINRSIMSFVIFNVPDNSTLQEMDSDNDDLNDWEELYQTYTDPFTADTDNDGATDYEEVNGASHGYLNSDPNNYTNTTDYRYSLNVKIVKPKNALYISNKMILPFFIPLVIMDIDVEVGLFDDVSRITNVEFFIDDELKANVTNEPFVWTWDVKTLLRFRHTIKVIAYDNAGNIASDEILVWKFF